MTLGPSRRDVVVEIVRRDSGVEARRGVRIVRAALLRPSDDSVARIMCTVLCGKSDAQVCTNIEESAFKCVCASKK